MNLRYEGHSTPLPEPLPTVLAESIAAIFGNQTSEQALDELIYQQARTPLRFDLAFVSQTLVGYKIGYERQPGQFYSWLGGVLPAFRGQGIASTLLMQQHDWCRAQGYQSIRTHTYNRWRSMLILNLRHGFDIVGTMQGKHGLTIILEKQLVDTDG